MRLYQLAYCCRLYAQVTNFDASIDKLRHTGGESLNPLNEEHARALLRLLNSWGCRQFAIQAHLGHSSIQVTMDRYGHLFPDALEKLAERLDAARAAARTDPARTEPQDVVVELPTRQARNGG
jgi:integrase